MPRCDYGAFLESSGNHLQCKPSSRSRPTRQRLELDRTNAVVQSRRPEPRRRRLFQRAECFPPGRLHPAPRSRTRCQVRRPRRCQELSSSPSAWRWASAGVNPANAAEPSAHEPTAVPVCEETTMRTPVSASGKLRLTAPVVVEIKTRFRTSPFLQTGGDERTSPLAKAVVTDATRTAVIAARTPWILGGRPSVGTLACPSGPTLPEVRLWIGGLVVAVAVVCAGCGSGEHLYSPTQVAAAFAKQGLPVVRFPRSTSRARTTSPAWSCIRNMPIRSWSASIRAEGRSRGHNQRSQRTRNMDKLEKSTASCGTSTCWAAD